MPFPRGGSGFEFLVLYRSPTDLVLVYHLLGVVQSKRYITKVTYRNYGYVSDWTTPIEIRRSMMPRIGYEEEGSDMLGYMPAEAPPSRMSLLFPGTGKSSVNVLS